MRYLLTIDDNLFVMDYAQAVSLAHPTKFDTGVSNPFGVAAAAALPKRFHNFLADTRLGGSCNVREVTSVPHCHGTHSESQSHVCHDLISINDCFGPEPMVACLLEVSGTAATDTSEGRPSNAGGNDQIITAASLDRAFQQLSLPPIRPTALVVRCANPEKWAQSHSGIEMPPYFSIEAMKWIRQWQCRHLLVNLPSVDRLDDGGVLACHRIFWDMDALGHELGSPARIHCTITELLHIPVNITVGMYALLLQIPPWMTDAAPCRPYLVPLRFLTKGEDISLRVDPGNAIRE